MGLDHATAVLPHACDGVFKVGRVRWVAVQPVDHAVKADEDPGPADSRRAVHHHRSGPSADAPVRGGRQFQQVGSVGIGDAEVRPTLVVVVVDVALPLALGGQLQV